MGRKSLTFVIALATAMIALGLLPSARSPELMVDIQAFTRLVDDDLWKSLNVFGHFLGAASILLLITRKMLIVWALVLSSLLGGCFSRALKLTLDVPRPAALMHEDLFIIGEKLTHGSMPSGHSMTIAIVFGLFLSLYPRFNPKAKRLGLPLTLADSRSLIASDIKDKLAQRLRDRTLDACCDCCLASNPGIHESELIGQPVLSCPDRAWLKPFKLGCHGTANPRYLLWIVMLCKILQISARPVALLWTCDADACLFRVVADFRSIVTRADQGSCARRKTRSNG